MARIPIVQDEPPQAEPAPPAEADDARPDETITPSLVPIRKDDFAYDQARHLLWRAGFGGTDAQVRRLVEWGPEKSVDTLLTFGDAAKAGPFEPPKPDLFDKDIMRPPTEEQRQMAQAARRSQNEDELARVRKLRQEREQQDRRQMREIQKWWLTRMIETKSPMEEKLTLFWHGHFATSFRTIENSYHMFAQNRMLRRNAAGNFADLLGGIIRDPAMISYLDNNESKKGRPNENLAREIMELFSLGVGHYTEDDIKQGARALTGYTYDDDTFAFRERDHDSGEKTILGRTGNWDGEDFVKLILSRRDCARFVTRRMYHYLVADVPPDERGGDKDLPAPQRQVLRELGDMLYARKYALKPVLRRLLLSRHFYDDSIMGQQIKSPAQLVVGAVRSLDTPVRDLSVLVDAMDRMGQNLFMPPSVKGWDGGRAWINTSTMYVRQNTLAYLLTGLRPQGNQPDPGSYDALQVLAGLSQGADPSPDETARTVLRVTLGRVPTAAMEALTAYLAREKNKVNTTTVTGCLLLATAMPEYQLC